MPNPLGRNSLWQFALAIGLIWLGAVVCLAQRLPVRQYTIADGLAQGTVWAMHRDVRGFLWLATSDGLSRFDGYRFTNYKKSGGLNYFRVYDVTADRQGRIWMATGEGLSLLLDASEAARQGKKFNQFLLSADNKPEGVNDTLRVLFDAENRMWVLTYTALFRAQSTEVVTGQFERIAEFDVANTPPQIIQDRRGRVWASVNQQLRCIEGGNVITYELWQEAGETKGNPDLRWIKGLVEANGRILVATNKDLYEFIEPAAAQQRGVWRKLPLTLPAKNTVGTIHAAPDGGLWIGTDGPLIRYRDGRQANYHLGNDPNPFLIQAMLTDRDGNLWIGTRQRGLLKLKGEAISVYDADDGLVPVMDYYGLRETHDGRVSMFGRAVSPLACNETFLTNNGEAKGLTQVKPPPSLCFHDLMQDRRKNWWGLRWLADRKIDRLYFIPGPELNFSKGYELTAADGWVDGGYSIFYEDEEGNLWLRSNGQIFRVEYRDNGRPHIVAVVKGSPSEHGVFFIRDLSGAIWWSNGGKLWRQQQGKIDTISLPIAPLQLHSFWADGKGRLWIGTVGHGVFMTEAPNSAQPRFVNYTTANGLGHNQVDTICEDDDGTLWFGTLNGLYRRDETTGRFHLVSLGEYPLGSAVRDLRKDKQGYLWASVMGAVYRFNPRMLPRATPQVPIYFNHVRVAGELLPIGETGIVHLPPLELAAGSNNLDIEFVSPNFRDETTVQYQYKLDGVDTDWSTPSNVREVNYARLAPDSYRFLVRAVSESGAVSAEAASLRFTILRPVWQRWWFVLMSVIGLAGIGYGLHRYRLAQLMGVEQVRTRIARDLHDDVGAGLSQISLLSEVIQRRAAHDAAIAEPLSAIAGTSRELVDTMSDIVWTNNPRFDHLGDLIYRCRRFATESLVPRGIRLHTDFPDNDGDLTLEPETRRQLYLIFKEAITNLARHADCDRAEISLRITDGWLQMRIADNGNGFDAEHKFDGNGLRSLRARAEAIGGNLEIESAPNAGTTLTLRLQV